MLNTQKWSFSFEFWSFEFISDFDIRISDLRS
jgi:hypothetical protein